MYLAGDRAVGAPVVIALDATAEVEELAALLRTKQWRLVTAESCTGGLIAAACTSVAASSDWFERGFVTYSNAAKTQMLGVSNDLIQTHGAVSREVALAMAQGALSNSSANLAVAVTGIAGPSGGSHDKPVGTVWIATAQLNAPAQAGCFLFAGDRSDVRAQSVVQALRSLLTRAALVA